MLPGRRRQPRRDCRARGGKCAEPTDHDAAPGFQTRVRRRFDGGRRARGSECPRGGRAPASQKALDLTHHSPGFHADHGSRPRGSVRPSVLRSIARRPVDRQRFPEDLRESAPEWPAWLILSCRMCDCGVCVGTVGYISRQRSTIARAGSERTYSPSRCRDPWSEGVRPDEGADDFGSGVESLAAEAHRRDARAGLIGGCSWRRCARAGNDIPRRILCGGAGDDRGFPVGATSGTALG